MLHVLMCTHKLKEVSNEHIWYFSRSSIYCTLLLYKMHQYVYLCTYYTAADHLYQYKGTHTCMTTGGLPLEHISSLPLLHVVLPLLLAGYTATCVLIAFLVAGSHYAMFPPHLCRIAVLPEIIYRWSLVPPTFPWLVNTYCLVHIHT